MTTRKIITSLILSIAISSQVHAASAVIGGFTVDNIEDSLITINKDNVTWIGGFHNNHFTLFDTVSSGNNT